MTYLNICLVFSFFSLVSIQAGSAGESHRIDRSFYKEYFAQNHQAILLPRPSPFSPGTVISSADFSAQANLSHCVKDGVNSEDLVRETFPGMSLRLSSSNWSTELQVSVEAQANATAGVSVRRLDEIIESEGKELKAIEQTLDIPHLVTQDYIADKCLSLYDSSDPKIKSGEFFVLDRLLTFEGEFKSKTYLGLQLNGNVSVKVSEFLKAARRFEWLKSIIDRFDFGVEGEVTAGRKTGETGIERFPPPGAEQVRSFIAFQPRYVNPDVLREIQILGTKLGDRFQQALLNEEEAISFLRNNPQFSAKSEESLLRRIFASNKGIPYAEVPEKYSAILTISDTLAINVLAGYIKL